MLCLAQDVITGAHSICGCAALQTKDQDNELLVRKLKERFERCVSTPELHAAHPCPLKRVLWLLGPCYLVNRVILWACMLPDKACGQLVVGRRGGSQDADSHSAVQQPGGECDGAYRQPRAALCLELLQEHGGGEALAPCLPVCIASFVAGLVHSHRGIRWSVCTAKRTAQATPPGVKIPPHILPRGARLMRPWTVCAVRR